MKAERFNHELTYSEGLQHPGLLTAGWARNQDQEKKDDADGGVVTNPETTPILVRMKLSVYDFGKSKTQVDAMLKEAAKDAAAPAQKEGK